MHIPVKNIYIVYLLVILGSCSPKQGTNPVLQQVDSLLEEHLDSALTLLKSFPSPQQLSEADYAHYALLMTVATDKQEQSLIPCDSLINFALDYYDEDNEKKAMALLYKGRLEEEIKNTQEAIKLYQQALDILPKYPQNPKTLLLIYSSLSEICLKAGLYKEFKEVNQKIYEQSITPKEKCLTLNSIGMYYCLQDEKDSTIMIQHKALEYALISQDSSLIASTLHNLSINFSMFEEFDSALYYAQKVVHEYPSSSKDKGKYYLNIGDLLIEKQKYDSASYYLSHALEFPSIEVQAIALRDLYEIEKISDNYKDACEYLDQYVQIQDSLVDTEQESEIAQLIYKYNTQIKVRETQIKERKILAAFCIGFLFVCFSIIIVYQYRINRKKREQLYYQQSLEKAHNKLSSLEIIIDDNESIIKLLKQEKEKLQQERLAKDAEIKKRTEMIDQLQKEKMELHNWTFYQTDIYKKILELSQQQVTDKKDRKVLIQSDRDLLKQIIFEIYANYISSLQKQCPKLTEDDLLCLCLSNTSLSTRTIALCFGQNDTHTLNQRKLRIKNKMKDT